MRFVLVALVLAGCGPDSYEYNAVAAAAKASELCDATQARADTMEKQLASTTAQLNMVTAQLATVTAARAQPHLVVAATGEDLGLYVGNNTAVVDAGGKAIVIKFDAPATLSFDGPNCSGTAYWSPPPEINRNGSLGAVSLDGYVLLIGSSEKAFKQQSSQLRHGGTFDCIPGNGSEASALPVIDTGTRAAFYDASALNVALK